MRKLCLGAQSLPCTFTLININILQKHPFIVIGVVTSTTIPVGEDFCLSPCPMTEGLPLCLVVIVITFLKVCVRWSANSCTKSVDIVFVGCFYLT